MRKNSKFLLSFFAITALVLVLSVFGRKEVLCEELAVNAAVDKQEVYVGEPFRFQIQISGDDSPAEPDLSGILADFNVEPRGGQQNSSTSITIINGKMQKVVKSGYNFNYSLTAKRAGRLVIPALTAQIGNKTFSTAPITIYAGKPEESEDFKLRLKLSKTQCYVGEPITLTLTWYIRKDVQNIQFNLPFVDDNRFIVEDIDDAATQPNAVRIPHAGGEFIGQKGEEILNEKSFTTLSIRKILFPRQTGRLDLPQATVTSQAVVGYQQQRSRDPFDDFFNFGKRPVYQTVVTPSNELSLEVLPLPEKGRPADFTGLVGKFSIIANADPTEVNVGDPITLKIQVAGPYVKNVAIPPLGDQPELADNFKIPVEMAPGETVSMIKTFTQTIRAKHAQVAEIPSLSLRFFNTAEGRYETARTNPIPLKVKETKVVTAMDAEGKEVLPAQQALQVFEKGIVHNYDGEDILITQAPKQQNGISKLLLFLVLGLPAVLYGVLLSSVAIARNRQKDPAAQKARKAFSHFTGRIKAFPKEADQQTSQARLDEALRTYLAEKLNLAPGAVTYGDVAPVLEKKNVPGDLLSALKSLFDELEALKYAGTSGSRSSYDELVAQTSSIVQQFEKVLK